MMQDAQTRQLDGTTQQQTAEARFSRKRIAQAQAIDLVGQGKLYLEKQYAQFCQVHALNAFFGRSIVTPQDMLHFCMQEIKSGTRLGGHLSASGYDQKTGNLPTMAIQAWLHRHTQPEVRLINIKTNYIVPGKSEMEIISELPQELDAFILSWNKGTERYKSTQCGHAMCVKRHARSGKWYLLDSEEDRPMLMTTTKWAELKGSISVLNTEGAYNHGAVYCAKKEGYPQSNNNMPHHIKPTHVSITREPNHIPNF